MRNFQDHQAAAMQQSSKLKMLLALTIAGTVLISAAAVTYLHLVYMMVDDKTDPSTHGTLLILTFIGTAVITAAVVGITSFMKQHELGEGGKVIADDLGRILLEEAKDED